MKSDLKKVVKREKTFATLAKKEGKSNAALAKKAHGANKKDLEWEASTDKDFAKKRTKRVKSAERKMK